MASTTNKKSFEELLAELLRYGQLYEDTDFPAVRSSIKPQGFVSRRIEWKRPKDIVDNPKFIVEGSTRFDLDQGALGDCWFVAAAACLAVSNRKLFERTVPHDQSFTTKYAGIFRFRFWRYDRWEEVIIDDRLPTKNGKLVYGSNREQPDEFWSALLEKAYAKLYGSYEGIDGGQTADALVDFTGGMSERIDLTQDKLPVNLYELMKRTVKMNSMLGCSIPGTTGTEEELTNGLYREHAYSITGLAQHWVGREQVKLLRIRNPWGRGEWNGKWSDKSYEWKHLTETQKSEMGLLPKDDGEFWMEYSDWLANFVTLEFCHLYPDSLTEEVAIDMNKRSWHVLKYHGEWIPGFSAGGCGNKPHEDKYWRNPQFAFTLEEEDDEDVDGKCTVVVSLLQKRQDRGHGMPVGYNLHKVRYGVAAIPDGSNYERGQTLPWYQSRTYVNLREITGRHVLIPASYVVVPATFEPEQAGRFMIRIFTEKTISGNEVDEPTVPIPHELPTVDKVEELFTKYAGKDGTMDDEEFQTTLNIYFKTELLQTANFSKDAARALLVMMDPDDSGFLTLPQFRAVIKDIEKWEKVFHKSDTDGSGKIDAWELYKLMKTLGVRVSRQALGGIIKRYAGRGKHISREDFMVIMAKLITMFEVFGKVSLPGLGSIATATFTLEEFISVTMVC